MKRNPIQDIKRSSPSMHKSIDLSHSHPIENDDNKILEDNVPVVAKLKEPIKPFRVRRRINKKLEFRTLFVVIGIVLFILGIYFLSIKYGHARVSIVEKREPFTFTDKAFKANRGSDLAFEVMIVSDTVEKEIILTESKEASSKATGVVVIYNSYSTAPQKLSINTRLVDDTGNIYYTDKALVVPGYTMLKGKIVPGSVSVGITASNSGDKYNGDPRDFTLLGFKGTPKATKIYARSKGPITGGSVGRMYIPSSEQKGELNNIVTSELRQKLAKNLQAQVPPGYILFQDSVGYDTNFNPDSIMSSNSNAVVKVGGSASAIILNERDLEKNVIKSANPTISDEEIEEITVPELRNFVFKIIGSANEINKETTTVNFTLTGAGVLSWKPKYEILVSNLVGVDKDQVNNIFITDPGIDKAKLTLIPPWQKTLPKNAKYIKIKVE